MARVASKPSLENMVVPTFVRAATIRWPGEVRQGSDVARNYAEEQEGGLMGRLQDAVPIVGPASDADD
jgi:hypothetical protein